MKMNIAIVRATAIVAISLVIYSERVSAAPAAAPPQRIDFSSVAVATQKALTIRVAQQTIYKYPTLFLYWRPVGGSWSTAGIPQNATCDADYYRCFNLNFSAPVEIRLGDGHWFYSTITKIVNP